jgi:hypothetical protein
MNDRARATDKITSIIAGDKIKPKLSSLKRLFYISLLRSEESWKFGEIYARQGHTANEVLQYVPTELRESVRKRVHELVRENEIREVGRRKCDVTGNLSTTYGSCAKK